MCQDFLEALDHFEEILEKVERDLGLLESQYGLSHRICIAGGEIKFAI